MAIRENLIQARSLYVGVSPNVAPASSNLGVDGSIGIGTPTPNERLHIVGNTGTRIRISSSDNYHIGNLGWEDTRVFLSAAGYGSPALGFDTAGSERMRITNGGNVGIGTTNPGYQLEVNGWVGAARYYPYNTNSSYIDGDGSGIRLNGPGYFYSAVSGGSYFEGPMRVRNSISNDTNSYLQINGGTANITYFAGTVGVGFTTMYHNASLSVANKLFIGQSNNTDIGGTIYGYWDSGYQAYAGGLKFQVFNANGGFPYTMKDSMTLSGSGNIGIGTTDPIASLDNQGVLGTYRQRGFTTMVTNELAADGTNANRYEIARATIDYNDWNDIGTIEIELYEKYWSDGLKKRYIVTYGYSAQANKYLVEMSGIGVNNFMVSIGAPVVISGDLRYLPIYVDVRYYSRVIAVVKTNRYLTTANPPGAGGIWFNNAPSITYIADTGMDSTVYVGPVMGANSVFAGGNVGIGTSAPPARLAVAGNNAGLALIGDTGLTHYTGISLNNNLSSGTYNFLSSPYDNSLFINRPSGNNIHFRENNNDQMVIRYGGLVGINTTNPQGYLDVNTGSANMTTYDYGVDLKVNAGGGFARSNRQYDVQSAITSFLGSYGNSTNGVERAYWTIGDRNSDVTGYTLTNGIHLLANGSVGIGTTSPFAKLTVSGDIYGGNILISNANFNSFGSTLSFTVNSSERMRITTNGNVGIGTTSPTEKLDVNGKTKTTTLQVTNGATNGYVLTSDASGNGTWQATSGGGGIHIAIPPRSGQGYGLITSPSNSPQSYGPGSNLLCWFPFIPSNNITIDRIIISVTTAAASGVAVFTIYSNTNGMPDRKLFASSNIDCSTTGYKSITTTQTFTAGNVYWFGLTLNNGSIRLAAHPPASSYSFAWLNSTGIPFAANNCVYFITTSPGSEPNVVDQSQVGFSFDNILNTIIRAV